MKNNKRTRIRMYTYSLALILCLGISNFIFYNKSTSYEYEQRARQQNAIIELAESVDGINIALNKGLYANTAPMVSRLSSELSRECATAKNALSQISVSGNFMENTYKYLSQVGDFVESLSKKFQSGENLTTDERDSIYSLLEYSNTLLNNIDTLIFEYESGKDFKIQTAGIETSLSDIEQSFEDYPTLIYDGPFSDHVNQEDAAMLSDFPEISEETAKAKAAKYSGLSENELFLGEEENGVFACYTFSTENTTVSVTKKGGLLCSLLSNTRTGEVKLSEKEAIVIAKEYLNTIGYDQMAETYYYTDDGICTINFALQVNNVVCYTDLIKVAVSLDNGRVLSVDARGYILNHSERSIAKPTLSVEEAKSSLAPNLKTSHVKEALIPSNYDTEFHCYEFFCTSAEGDDVLVYIDSETGLERDILLLLYSDNGTLTK